MLSRAQARLRPRSSRAILRQNHDRLYHDESFGFRKPRPFSVPDYTPEQLANRSVNAPLQRYVDSLRMHGHRAASIDPLDLLQREEVAALNPDRYGLDKTATYCIDGIIWTGSKEPEWWPLDKITRHLRETYVGRIAYEYMHSPSKTERLWFSHLLESTKEGEAGGSTMSEEDSKRRIWELLARSEVLDQFLQLKFPNLKRYGLEGGESMIPALDALFSAASFAGIEHVILAMPHRGRLNLLLDLLRFSPTALFHKVKGGSEIPEELDVSGDVVSHLFTSNSIAYPGANNPIKVTLLPNPSHLEAVNPVAMGKTRAKQFSLLESSDADCTLGDKVMCVQLHGDASFTGQGVVMESLGLSNLPHYTSGGSVHIVVNIGYTTPASSARSSLYCSDIGKMIHAPVLHVNGDHPEDVQRAIRVAFKYRNHFRKDVIIDLLVYRRWGHNELDEPGFTQPQMYSKIRARKSIPSLYEEKLLEQKVVTTDEIFKFRKEYKDVLEGHLAKTDDYLPKAEMLQDRWSSMVWPASKEADHAPDTGVDVEVLRGVGKASVHVPADFDLHPRLQRHIKSRVQSLDSGSGIGWGTAEALAFGSLMKEGYSVRISGQDVGRGTFSHRHAMLVDQTTEGIFVPLNEASDSEGKLELANSSLSEMAVLGFEYGFSWESPNFLPIWEAQFGDFFNGSQVIIDTFISSAETKWLKQSGITVLLPHGLDGAGPEHSSMRIERFLQLTDDDFSGATKNVNMHIVNPTTAGQYFHLLRRQMKRNYRKPLIVAAPKSLLRAAVASSTLKDLAPGTKFEPILDDLSGPRNVKTVVLCSGKIYYDLRREREARELDRDVALIRVEELSPFPFEELWSTLKEYVNRSSQEPQFVWVQEEARNQGPWTHVRERMNNVLREIQVGSPIQYWGRRVSAVPAVGVGRKYKDEQREVVEGAFAGARR
ncbi:dehydrogenase E1 and transketolase domain-containing protein 1 [Sistotremastrum niveocremeum HHB9708]|uniref:Dehydrogenase E1 and transketolase domain-containing protein 1 n=2 Tax=Sistotremastraceae TaxID=3402574 RepID=A0A164XXB2_9AGAM|nr:dehydrogenase E1 and transketolase domain-containing protein 1 [Sistotremastrum niveocremeum HHB9708]KZT35327.1 2-oxoglutarate dehydrogenase, E1 component [Sistotremastrum suecicum HHB10207 ss-3]